MKDIVAFIFGLGLFVNALIFVPQVVQIWRLKRADSISLATFAGFNILQAIGVIHGYFQHDLALLFGMIASLITSGSVTLLTVVYRRSAKPPAAAAGPTP
jgi:MtN3 and saliva related transmembrane protein